MDVKIIYSSILLIFFGCFSYAGKSGNLAHDFFQLSISERERQFNSYSLDEQYELFIFGNQVVHPPATYLAYPFAKQGPVIVPFLKTKLKDTQNELTVRDITLILLWLARLKLYDFSKDQELLDLMDQRVHDMHGIWKETTLEMIVEIRSVRGKE